MRNRKTGTRERGKAGRAIGIFVAVYTLYNFIFALSGLRLVRANVAVGMTVFMLALIGITIGIISAKVRRGKVSGGAKSRTAPAAEKFSGAAAKSAERVKIRPRAKTVQCAAGESHERTVGEDCFVLSSRDPLTRRREQLETLYRAGLYTREEYAAEREKLRTRYGSI